MGKRPSESKRKDKDGETKVLFKKSNATMFVHSRTGSATSQLFSRSGMLLIKKNLENSHNYYTDRGKLKRDLSVETDFCIMRRYYRGKKNKMSTQDGSAKSKYSTVVDTEVETIEEFPDMSACGDNDTDNKSNPPLDLASVMLDNLKDLINQWIQKHLLENKDTKQKIDTVLDNLMQKLDQKGNLGSSSGSTYVLHREATNQEVKNKKVSTASITRQYCKHSRNVKVGSSSNISEKSSSLTLPLQYKDIRIISTLSIPRSFHKRGMEEKKDDHGSWYKMKKIKHKNIILSIDKSNKLIDSSSYDLVAISTKSLTKRCNYDMNVKKKKRHIVFFPKPFYKSATDISSTTNNEHSKINNIEITKHHLDDMPSLLKSLYYNDPVITSTLDKNIQYDTRNDNGTMTEKNSNELINKARSEKTKDGYVKIKNGKSLYEGDQSEPIVTIDFVDQKVKYPTPKNSKTIKITKEENLKISKSYKKISDKGKINKRKKRTPNKLTSNFKAPKYQNIHNKQFTFLYKKANDQMSQGKEFMKHCQNIIQYFEDYNGNKNIKLDVRINVFPIFENRTKDVCTNISNEASGIHDTMGGPTLLYNVRPTQECAPVQIDEESIKDPTENSSCNYVPEIIPLLDGAVSQTKYIFNENPREKLDTVSKHNSVIEQGTLTSELEIVQEISELRSVIKDLAAAAEKFVSEQVKRDSNKSNAQQTNMSENESNIFISSPKAETVNQKNPSIAVQYSREFNEKQKLLSGLKISKEPKKKDNFEFYNRLAKKSTSYRIIDSESILRVTDMTSKGNEFNEYKLMHADEALTCCLPKSRSLFEMTSDQIHGRKLIAMYCDGYQKCTQCRVCSVHPAPSSSSESSKSTFKNWFCRKRKVDRCCVKKKETPPPAKKKKKKKVEKSLSSCVCRLASMSADSELQEKPEKQEKPKKKKKKAEKSLSSCVCRMTSDADSDPNNITMLKPESLNFGYSSTMSIPPEKPHEKVKEKRNYLDEENNISVCCDMTKQKCKKVRKGMGFGEGCVYCLLMWIPILIILILLYVFVLKKNMNYPDEVRVVGRQGPERATTRPIPRRNQSSLFYVKLADLGF
nr:uncharacterized protein LOC110381137 [Helicoverpa armigera]